MDKSNGSVDKPTTSVKLFKYSIDSILGKHEKKIQNTDSVKLQDTPQISTPRCK